MGSSRTVQLILALVLLVLANVALAGEVTPAMVWTGTAPSGSCAGSRVAFAVTTGQTYCCSSGTWATCGVVPVATSTTIGGVKGTGSALVCSGTDKVTGFASDGTLQCATDQGGTYTLPAAQANTLGGVKGTGASLTCAANNYAYGFAADGTMQCRADQTGGMAYYESSSDLSTTSTGFSTVTGLSWSAGTNSQFTCFLRWSSGSTTSATKFQVSGPSGTTYVTEVWNGTAVAYSYTAASSATTNATFGNKWFARIIGGTAGTSGTVTVQYASSSNGTTAWVYAGAFCLITP